jgi:Na+/proline symporter
MSLSNLDWSIIGLFFLVSMGIGLYASRKAGQSTQEFFLSGRNMPWWLLGVSMVATTFSADTPNLVTDIVRKDGVSGNWVWWAYLLTGMLTVFVYAKLWRRSEVMTDLEFYKIRYSGPIAKYLRIFRAIYLGVIFNVLVMSAVCLAAIKIGGTLLDLSPIQTLLIASVITVSYSALGGLRGILLTDFFQFILAMIGTVWASVVIINLPMIGGLDRLLVHSNVVDKLDLIPSISNGEAFISLMVIPLAVQWWASYYPGAEPGGGGYIAQRMLAAKDEEHAIKATLFFNIAHYALRPWPWILIALASLIVFPDLNSLEVAFPNIAKEVINDDLAYPAMLTYLPSGLLGLVIASLLAAFMSTISTHLNWGASYVIHDVYRNLKGDDIDEKKLVNYARITTVVLMILSGYVALNLDSAKSIFDLIVLMGAGTGLIYILRWFWWRINAYSEIAAMVVSFVVALTLKYTDLFEGHIQLLLGVFITTVAWIVVTFMTRPTNRHHLISFYKRVKPHSLGWKPIIEQAKREGSLSSDLSTGSFAREFLCMLLGVVLVYAALFSIGYVLYGDTIKSVVGLIVVVISSVVLMKQWRGANS